MGGRCSRFKRRVAFQCVQDADSANILHSWTGAPAGMQQSLVDSSQMNKELATIPDYQAAIYQTLLRIEQCLMERPLTNREPDHVPTITHAKPTMSMNDAAQYLGDGRSSLYELVRTKRIRSVRVGRRILIPTHALDAYIADEKPD